MVSGNKINKYGMLAAILFTVPILLLFRWIHGENMAHVSLLIFWLCALAGFGVNLLLHALFFGIFSSKGFRSISFVKHKGGIRFCHCNEPIRMWQYRTTCFLPILLLNIIFRYFRQYFFTQSYNKIRQLIFLDFPPFFRRTRISFKAFLFFRHIVL